MNLILEQYPENSFKFLEGKLKVSQEKLSCLWASKNFDSLLDSGKMKILSSQDFFSYSGDKRKIAKKAVVMGKLCTLMGYTFSDADVIYSFGCLLCDLYARSFQKRYSKFQKYDL